MYLIDETYFNKDIKVTGLNSQTDTSTRDLLIEYIDGMARLVMQESLGFELFNELDSYVTNGVLDNDAPQKWQHLVNGTSYTHESNEYKWKGLLVQEGTYKTSLLAYYTFFRYKLDTYTIATDQGNVMLDVNNTVRVNADTPIRMAWNNFVKMYVGGSSNNYVGLIEFLEHNKTDYPEAAKSMTINKRKIKHINWARI